MSTPEKRYVVRNSAGLYLTVWGWSPGWTASVANAVLFPQTEGPIKSSALLDWAEDQPTKCQRVPARCRDGDRYPELL